MFRVGFLQVVTEGVKKKTPYNVLGRLAFD